MSRLASRSASRAASGPFSWHWRWAPTSHRVTRSVSAAYSSAGSRPYAIGMYMWLYAMYSAAPAASGRAKYGDRRTFGCRRGLAMPPPYQRRVPPQAPAGLPPVFRFFFWLGFGFFFFFLVV